MSARSRLRILVVDDDVGITSLLAEELADAGFDPTPAQSVEEALRLLAASRFDLVVSDLILPDGRGEEVLRAVRRHDATIPVIIITAFGSIELATELVRKGAADFLTKPFTPTQLVLSVSRALVQARFSGEREESSSVRASETAPSLERTPAPLAGARAAREGRLPLQELLQRASSTDANLLLVGESGVGKTRLARTVHDGSPRASKPFVALNCAAISPSLVESELFGVVQGAYTDARRDREGLILSARGGTLFLDEIADMPLEAQAKLLRVLERKVVRPVGSAAELPVDVRVISATNQSLEDAVAARRFRADLYYRLHVIKIEVPPLRERLDELDAIADAILASVSGGERRAFSDDARAWMRAWHWPGNIRELANRIERSVALSDSPVIGVADLGDAEDASIHALTANKLVVDAAFTPRTLAEVERTHIEQTLDYTGGNKTLAAELLGIDRKTLYRKLAES